jgi:RND family efflux transporter MFP subunit
MRKSKTWIALILAIGAVVYLLMPRPTPIEVAEITRGDLDTELSTTGVVESDLVDIAPKTVGRITALAVQEGDMVSPGQEIAFLEDTDLASQVDGARAAVAAAEADYLRAEAAVTAQRRQSSAFIARAKAAIGTSDAQLADLQSGARPEEIEQAKENVAQAQAQMERARSDFGRAEKLFAQGAIPAQQRDAAKTSADATSAAYRAAQAQLSLLKAGPRPDAVRAAKAQLAASEAALNEALASKDAIRVGERQADSASAQVARAKAGLSAATSQLDYAVVRSPFRGVVARKHMEIGELAGPQTPIYTLAPMQKTWVTAEVDQEDLASLDAGQKVSITTDAYPGRSAKGRVIIVSAIAEPKAVGRVRAKIVRARIEVESSTFPLKPGMEVDIAGHKRIGSNVVLVPNEALVQVGERQQVYVISNGRVHQRFVTPGLSNYEQTAVLSGLKPGDVVAVSMPDRMQDGQRVKIERAPVESR